jgi:UDP-N-acetylglucosamine 1-carboxyvinyltransferase
MLSHFSEAKLVEKLYIKGGTPLKGEVSVGGAKNSVLKLIAAALLVKGATKIYNVPQLTDVDIMLQVIEQLGAKIDYNKEEKSVVIDATTLTSVTATYELVSKMRASFVVLGALFSRCSNLTSVDFNRANLIECSFSESVLNGTDFSY